MDGGETGGNCKRHQRVVQKVDSKSEHEKMVGVNRRLRRLGHRTKNFLLLRVPSSHPSKGDRNHETFQFSSFDAGYADTLVQTIRIVHRCRIVPLPASENLFESLHALAPSLANSKNGLLQRPPPMHPTKISRSLPSQWYNHKTLKLGLTKPLLALLSILLNNLNHTRPKGLDGRNVVGEDAHVTSSSGDVDLDDTGRRVEGLLAGGQGHVDMDRANFKN